MEGLAGVVYPEVFQVNHHVDNMLNTLRHRKSEPRDIFSYKNLRFGIIGNTLATNDKKSVYVALDGNLVNFDDLCLNLKKNGLTPSHPLTPEEVVVQGYELEGVNFIKQLSGDFALALFDQHKEKMILARDPLGKKPLYWFHDHRYFIFGSELKALIASGLVPQTISKEAIAAYLHFGYIPQDMAPIKDVNKLLPGHYLQLNLHQNVSIQSFWSYSSYFESKPSPKKNILLHSLSHLTEKAISSRLGSEEFIGLLISDRPSSKILEEDVKKIGGKRQFFPYFVRSQSDDFSLDTLVPIVWYLDEPQADQDFLPVWHSAAQAAGKIPVVFSDFGYQEFFGMQAYYSPDREALASKYRRSSLPLPIIKRMIVKGLNYIYEPMALQFLKNVRAHSWQTELFRRHALFDETVLPAAFPRLTGVFDLQSFLNKFHNLSRIKNLNSALLYLDVKTHLVDASLLQLERMTAAHGLNLQTPFLDQDLVKFLASHAQLSNQETFIETQAPIGKFPEFNTILSFLPKGCLVEAGLLSEAWLSKQIKKHLEKPQTLSFKYLWAILILEVWYRLYIVRPFTQTSPTGTLKEILMKR